MRALSVAAFADNIDPFHTRQLILPNVEGVCLAFSGNIAVSSEKNINGAARELIANIGVSIKE